jgi:inosine-uridine nucleoside N-ribohydrolase
MQFQGDELMEECNTMLDPVAAGAAFQRNLPVHRIAGLNVTRGHALTKEQVSAAFTGDRLGGLRGCCGIWADRNQTGKVGLHDPLTATLIFNPDFAEYRRGRIGVKLFDHDRNERFPFTDDQHTGATYFEPDPEGPHEMASRFDSDAMIEHIVRTIGGEEAVSTMASAG